MSLTTRRTRILRLRCSWSNGLLVACLLAGYLLESASGQGSEHREHEAFHIHVDLLVVIDGRRLDLSQGRYQSDDFRQLDPDLHLHNGEGDILHIHAPEHSLAQFFDSLGMQLTDRYLRIEQGIEQGIGQGVAGAGGNSGDRQLTLLANGRPVAADYQMADLDRILVMYGNSESAQITALMAEVSDRACIYSGTCPERGTPPPETCGSADGGCPPPWAQE